jgi:hypothetical protein
MQASPMNPNNSVGSSLPDATFGRRSVGSYSDYASASKAVDFLSDKGFPVKRVAIVAEGLRFVEQVTGRLDWGVAVMQGAISGAITGLTFALLFNLFNFIQPLIPLGTLLISGLLYGAILGAVLGVISYALSGGRRDFLSLGGMQAEKYNIMVDNEVADQAQQLMYQMR